MQDISEGRCAAYGCGHRALVSTFPFCNEHRDLPQPANSAPSPAQTPRRITVAPCRGDNCHDYGNATNHGYCNSRTRAPHTRQETEDPRRATVAPCLRNNCPNYGNATNHGYCNSCARAAHTRQEAEGCSRATVAPCRGDNCPNYGNATNHGYCNSCARAAHAMQQAEDRSHATVALCRGNNCPNYGNATNHGYCNSCARAAHTRQEAEDPRRATVDPCLRNNCPNYGNATNHGYCNSCARAASTHRPLSISERQETGAVGEAVPSRSSNCFVETPMGMIQTQSPKEVIERAMSCLQNLLNAGIKSIRFSRSCIVTEMLQYYESNEAVLRQGIQVELLGEQGDDFGGLSKEIFTLFFTETRNTYFVGEDCSVPHLPLNKMRRECGKFQIIGRILAHSVSITGFIPVYLAKTTFLALGSGQTPSDDILFEDFLLFVTERERSLIKKSMRDFTSLSEDERERLMSFFTSYSFHDVPREGELKEQILSIAEEQLVTKPAPLVKNMAEGIPSDHCDAFWNLLGSAEVEYLQELQRPTPEKVAQCIRPSSEALRDSEERVLYFFKEFIMSLPMNMLEDLLLFVTASVQQPQEIVVSFINTAGAQRHPIAHTCANLIELPTSYSSFQEFQREFNAVLNSRDAFVYSAI